MNIVQEPLPGGQPLAEALIQHFNEVSRFYEYNPVSDHSWSDRLDWLDTGSDLKVDRRKLVEILREYNRKHNPHEMVEGHLDQLEQPGTAVIVGGQQSGLFTGPLLVIYKAVTIIKAAEEASRKLDRPVVPVFWIAGEDHDWDEVDHAYVLSPELQVTRIRLEQERHDKGRPVSWTALDQQAWDQAAKQLQELLPDTEFKEGLMRLFSEAAASSTTLTDCFAKLMGEWFGKYGLILLDSADPELRRLEIPVFEAMIERNDALEEAYIKTASEIQRQGYPVQAEAREHGANLFYVHEGERLLLYKQDGSFGDRKNKVSFTKDELLQELHLHPERFSNNVLTRPLMQDALLPVLGTVLGAGETAYWGLTRDAFRELGLRMPILLMRESFTVLEGTLQKHLDKYGLTWADISNRETFQAKREAWLAGQDTLNVSGRFAEIKAAFTGMYEPLIEQLGGIQGGLIKLGNANRDKIMDQIEYLHGKAKDALEKSNETGLRHFDRIELSLFPLGRPQERVYNVFYYLNRYGTDWIDGLLGIPYDVTGKHRVLYL
ncbi:bacillithiol biosynthesis cysteine-adding enzyme BshC [Paenibacillus sp. DYY-L-2]|uniref:bacillithiol biosynthesis cysteine-adding enzyme BshC n=1 Tax=Paenibacillus sp. DYY-L-2 TaxID=3447013 RepID=UPI003F50B5EC